MVITICEAGLGAIFGAVIRYWLTDYGKKHWMHNFPYATLLINLSGAFLLGLVFSLKLSPILYTLLGTGVLGGYTTFSTMNVELLQKLKDKKYLIFWLYLITSYFGGFIAVVAGYVLGQV